LEVNTPFWQRLNTLAPPLLDQERLRTRELDYTTQIYNIIFVNQLCISISSHYSFVGARNLGTCSLTYSTYREFARTSSMNETLDGWMDGCMWSIHILIHIHKHTLSLVSLKTPPSVLRVSGFIYSAVSRLCIENRRAEHCYG
jgi:hypothetical protein